MRSGWMMGLYLLAVAAVGFGLLWTNRAPPVAGRSEGPQTISAPPRAPAPPPAGPRTDQPERTAVDTEAAPEPHPTAEGGLLVHVVDPHGEPVADVTVVLECVYDDGVQALASGASGPDGIVHLPRERCGGTKLVRKRHALGFVQTARVTLPHDAEQRVRVDLALGRALQRTITPQTEQVVLELPPLGTVAARLVDAENQPLAAGQLRLFWRRTGTGPWHEDLRATVVTTPQGEEAWWRVGTGLDIQLRARPEDGLSYDDAQLQLAGPSEHGQRVEATVRLRPWRCVLRGTLADAAGRPVPEARFLVKLRRRARPADRNGSTTPSQVFGRTDAAGRFELDVSHFGSAGVGRVADVLLAGTRSGRGLTDGAFFARIPLPNPLPAHGLDCGNVTLGGVPLVADGQVIDETGRPVRGVLVYATGASATPVGAQSTAASASCTTDEKGHFELRNTAFSGAVRLIVKRHSNAPPVLPSAERPLGELVIEAGSRDVRVTIARPPPRGRVAGSLALPPDAPMDDLHVVALAEAGAVELVSGRRDFEVKLPPGSADLQIRLRGASQLLREIPDIAVPPGEATRDPRLRDIDLRSAVRVLRLQVEGADGSTRQRHLTLRAGPRVVPFRTDHNGRARLLVAVDESEFVVAEDRECPSASFHWAHGEQRIILP
ncbi:MAG: hypothetical protein AAF628_23435 [Planctomycetota bacterium]